jgi:hypothetical protein
LPLAKTLVIGGLTSCRSSRHAAPGDLPGVCFSSNASRKAASTPPGEQKPPANYPPNRLSTLKRRIHETRMDIGRTGRTGANSFVSSLAGNPQVNLARSTSYKQKPPPTRRTNSRTPAEKLEKYAKGLEKQPSFHVIRLEKHQKSMKKSLPNRQGGKARDANAAGGIAL